MRFDPEDLPIVFLYWVFAAALAAVAWFGAIGKRWKWFAPAVAAFSFIELVLLSYADRLVTVSAMLLVLLTLTPPSWGRGRKTASQSAD